MYDVIIIGKSAFWSEKRMYAVELPRQTAESLIPVMMQNREALWRN